MLRTRSGEGGEKYNNISEREWGEMLQGMTYGMSVYVKWHVYRI